MMITLKKCVDKVLELVGLVIIFPFFCFYYIYYSLKLRNLIKLRPLTSDFLVFKQIFIDCEYDFPLGFEPKIIIDAGANVGYASIWFALKFKNAKIIAIEPEESNFSCLKQNVSSFKNVIPIKAALWNEKTKLNILDTGCGHWGYVVGKNKNNSLELTPTVTILELMEKYSLSEIDLLKIDIEGAEKELFDYKSKKWIGKVKSIFVELHDRIKPGCTIALNKAIKNQKFITSQSGEYLVLIRS